MLDAYIISLENPQKLLDDIKNKYNLNPILIKGINGKKLTSEEIKNNTEKLYSLFGPKSAIGCAMAHIKTWKTFIDSGKEKCIIFEDDVVFKKNFNEHLKNSTQHTPSDFDILFLGCLGCDKEYNFLSSVYNILSGKNRKIKYINKYIFEPEFVSGLHAYMISKKGAIKLVYYLEKKISDHIDLSIFKLYAENKLNIYCLNERIAYQTSTNNCNSLNATNYPYTLNKIYSLVEVDKMVKLNYVMSVSFCRIWNFNISCNTVLFLILGIIFSFCGISIKVISAIFILISIVDILYLKNINVMLFNYIIIIFPSLIRHLLNNKLK